jgi:hypothetical protein
MENQQRAPLLVNSIGDEVGQAKGSDMTRNWRRIAIRRFWIRDFFCDFPTEVTKRKKRIYRKFRMVERIEGE